jgi:hypothetical protein
VKPIDEISTEDLIIELLDRHTHSVFVGVIENKGKRFHKRHYAGNHHYCIGLIGNMMSFISKEIEEDERDLEDGEEEA